MRKRSLRRRNAWSVVQNRIEQNFIFKTGPPGRLESSQSFRADQLSSRFLKEMATEIPLLTLIYQA